MYNSNSEGEQWESQCVSNVSTLQEHSIIGNSDVEYEELIIPNPTRVPGKITTHPTESIAIQADTISSIFRKLDKECKKFKKVSDDTLAKLEKEKSNLLYQNQFLEEKNASIMEEIKMHELYKAKQEAENNGVKAKLQKSKAAKDQMQRQIDKLESLYNQSESIRKTEVETLRKELISYKQLYDSSFNKLSNSDRFDRAKSTEKRGDRPYTMRKDIDDKYKLRKKENIMYFSE